MRYEDVAVDEAIDLICTLPRGSHYKAKKHPELAWSEEHEAIADVGDFVVDVMCALRGVDSTQRPHMTRPRDIVARQKALQKRQRIKDKLNSTHWEEVN